MASDATSLRDHWPGRDTAERLVANARTGLRRAAAWRMLGAGPPPWLILRLGPETGELSAQGWPWSGLRTGRRPGPSLLTALRIIEAAARDPRLGGLLLRFEGPLGGWSRAQSVRRAIERARAAGLRIAAWSESYSVQDYWIASAAERVWLPPSGSVGLVGLRTDHFFLKKALDRFDVRADVVRVGGYKSAGELFTREGMSPAQREQIEAWLDVVDGDLVAGIAEGRRLDEARVRDLIDGGPHGAAAAEESGLVDDRMYPDEVDRALEALGAELAPPKEGDGEARVRWIDAGQYAGLVALDAGWRPLVGDWPRIVYAVARGPIRRGDGRGVVGAGIDSRTWSERLSEWARRDDVGAVVLRIDSPGGDAVASDLLYRATARLAAEKPVVVSMGDVAASGGYFMAAAGASILAESATLTGSIGVVGGKLDLGGLYRRLGVGHESLERGARAGLSSEARGFRPDEREAVRREMEALYSTFVERVAEGRGMSTDAIRKLGGGRVWSGRQALERGLVDRLGGPLEAIEDAVARAGLPTDRSPRIDVEPRRPRWLGARALLGASLELGPD